jgi:hypothetical protein
MDAKDVPHGVVREQWYKSSVTGLWRRVYIYTPAGYDEGKDKYANIRAEMYFNLAYQIKHGLCVEGLNDSAELKRQLCAIGWLHNNQGRLLLTKKEDLRAVLKCSPDLADALALTCLTRYTGDDPVMNRAQLRDREQLARWANMMG